MNGEGEQSIKTLHVLPKPSFGCVWEECIVIAFGENLKYKYVQMNAPSSIRKSKSPTHELIKSPTIDGAHRHRLRYEGGAPPDAESYFIQLLQSELREQTLTRRLKPVITAVEALFATLHDVVHPLDEKRSVHINKAVIKKLNAAIRQVWAQAGPILRTAGYYDADDDVLQLEIEEVFQRYMRQLVSHLIIRTLGTPADLERNRDAPMIRRLLVSFSKVLVNHMGPSYPKTRSERFARQLYAPQTKILEGGTKDEIRISIDFFNCQWPNEKCFEIRISSFVPPSKIFVWDGVNFILIRLGNNNRMSNT